MRKIILLLGLLLVISACKSRKIRTADKYIIEDLAEIASAAKLNEVYPDAKTTEGTGMFEEGMIERAYNVMYPDTPNEVTLTWKDRNRTRLHIVRVDNKGNWKSETGIKIGTTLEELEAINGAPILFYGFGWDYSGAVDWNGGKLSDTNLRIFLAPKEEPPIKFFGDQIIEASPQEIEQLDLSVRTIIYRKPNNFMSFSY